MKTAKIKGKVKGALNPPQVCRIPEEKFCLYAGFIGLLPGEFNGTRRKIYSGHLPACIRQCDDIGAGATADINRATRFMILDEIEELRWTNACIPRWLPKIPVMEKKAAE